MQIGSSSKPAAPLPLAGKKIVLDPGHGGQYLGAVGPAKTQEKDVTLAVATNLARDLVELGAQVRMTRTSDTQVAPVGSTLTQDLMARVAVANSWPADLFVSIHCNASSHGDPNDHGSEAYVYGQAKPEATRLATDLHQHMVNDCKLPDGQVRQANFWVIKHTDMPSTLIETAYISNAEEEQFLAKPENQKSMADALSRGVQQYFSEGNLTAK